MSTEKSDWDILWDGISEINEYFHDDIVLIGGIAVWLHSKRFMKEAFIDLSHDVDFMISIAGYSDIRDVEEVTANKRLNKNQLIKNGIDFDIYVENNNSLVVPFKNIKSDCEEINGFQCASLEHLLALKIKAWEDRIGSAKGDKDERDIARILNLFSSERYLDTNSQKLMFIDPDSMKNIESIVKNQSLFLDIACGNAYNARQIREGAKKGYERINKAYFSMPDDICTSESRTPESPKQ